MQFGCLIHLDDGHGLIALRQTGPPQNRPDTGSAEFVELGQLLGGDAGLVVGEELFSRLMS